MKPIRRELLNGLFVLVLASLIHAAFEAFHLNFNIVLWALIVMGVAVAVSGYVVFESVLSAHAGEELTRQREEEWLKRVGTPARLDLNREGIGTVAVVEAVRAMRPGDDLTMMYYFGAEGGKGTPFAKEGPQQVFSAILELMNRGTIREYKRIICFDHRVLANDRDLKVGVLRVGEGPGTISREMAEHCRWMMKTKGCSLYLAPVVFRALVALYGTAKASFSVETINQDDGDRGIPGILLFSDPPNGEIIEQLRQMERATERRMVAVRGIRFPEDAAVTAEAVTR
jgi:hypothetical protein